MSSNKPEGQVAVITDASCLIILDKLSQLHLLHELFPAILTTPEIAVEYGNPLPEWIEVVSVKNKSMLNKFAAIVDIGEASAIALAHEIETRYVITDDLEARKFAIRLGLSVIGSLGVLVRAKESGHILLVKPFVDQMKNTNFRVSEELYQVTLRKAGEQ